MQPNIPYSENHYNMTSTSQQYPPPQHSGRVPNIMDSSKFTLPFTLTNGTPLYQDTRTELIGHMHAKTDLNESFFSQSNIELLHQRIQEQVFVMSGNKHRIDRQSDDDLKLIMRSYYLMFGKNNPTSVAQDMDDLNSRVVGYAAAKIYSELDFYLFYIKDIQDFAPPIANPTNVKIYGSKTGELKSFF